MYIFVFVLSEVSHRLSLDQWSSGPVMCGGSIVKKMIAAGAYVERVKENDKDVKEHGSICTFLFVFTLDISMWKMTFHGALMI